MTPKLAAFFAFIYLLPLNTHSQNNLRTLITPSLKFRDDGKILIPTYIKHIKLDIGLSYSAPMSQYWLTHEDNVLIFGFEPNPDSVSSIFKGATKQHHSHGDPLETRFIGNQFYLIPVALGSQSMCNSSMQFYVTKDDCGCSSLYRPKEMAVDRTISVPVFSLSDFFELFPFDTHPVIDYIKIDAQGADLEIAKGAAHYLAERVIYITLEPENSGYENTQNSVQHIEDYMRSIGFIRHKSQDVGDPTFFNPRFSDYVKHNEIKIYQRG